METRKLGKIKEDISLLGFGTMRYPRLEQGFDMEQLRAMFDWAMQAGVNYYDTAYVYDNGDSEKLLGQLLVDRYPRDRFYVADKMPGWLLPKGAGATDMMDFLDESLERLHTDYADFYLIHSLSGESWARLVDKGVGDFLARLRESAKVRYIGFSFHDLPARLPAVADFFDWDFAQIQLNYFDWEGDQQAKGQYEYLTRQGLPVISMESVRGGSLAALPEDALAALTPHTAFSPAALALRWVASLPNVLTVLSGMSTLAQVEENCRAFRDFQALTAAEYQAVEEALACLRQRELVLCTACRYCAGQCPQHIDIPRAMKGLNIHRTLQNRASLYNYIRLVKQGQEPTACLACGACREHCPQKLDIPAYLAELVQSLGEHGL